MFTRGFNQDQYDAVISSYVHAMSTCHGQEYDAAEEEGLSAAERLARQRRGLNKRLGLGSQMDALLDTADLVKDEDLVGNGGSGGNINVSGGASQQKAAGDLLSDMSAAESVEMAGAPQSCTVKHLSSYTGRTGAA